jgi:hypothetical protein
MIKRNSRTIKIMRIYKMEKIKINIIKTKVKTFYIQNKNGEATSITVNRNLIKLYNEFLPEEERAGSIRKLINDFKHINLNSFVIEGLIFEVIFNNIREKKEKNGQEYDF